MAADIRAAAIQLRAHDCNTFMQSLDSTIESVRDASERSDLVVLPESTFPGYIIGDVPVDDAQVQAAVARLREIAAATRTVIVAGLAATLEGCVRNSALVIDTDGSLAGQADKLFLWHFDRRWFVAGERLEPIPTAIGVLGVHVCADGRLPTIARRLVDLGAEILVMPTAWVTSGRDPDNLENVQADLLARVRAYENRVPFVAANKCGSERGIVAYCGKSQIIDSRGHIVAVASQHDPQTLHATVAFTKDRPPRKPAAPLPPVSRRDRTLRVAISFEALPDDIPRRLEYLDDVYALSPHQQITTASAETLDVARVDDATVLDPAGLLPYHRAGYALIAWKTQLDPPWSQYIARARALELRFYVVVFDGSMRRAFAVDPDGVVVAGTFEDFRIASFLFDSGKTAQAEVAPRTDLFEGLERVEAIIGNSAQR